MSDGNPPSMPLAPSSNMKMSISTAPAKLQTPGGTVNTQKATELHSIHSEPASPEEVFVNPDRPTDTKLLSNTQHDRTQSREKILGLQRIQLARQLHEERELCTNLQSRVTFLQDKLASLVMSNEAAETERVSLRRLVNEASEKAQEQQHTLRRVEAEAEEATRVMNEMRQKVHCTTKEASDMKASHEARESDLKQRLTDKGDENKKLKQEIITLRTACADAITRKEAAEKKAQNEYQEEARKLQEKITELQNTTKPFPQVVVIGVDVSGSTFNVFHQIKQAYRDVLHVLRSHNSQVRVSVILHGSGERHDPTPAQTITHATFRIVEDNIDNLEGTEDYAYCLEKANGILSMYTNSKRLVILIGDGDGNYGSPGVLAGCKLLISVKILAHSIVIPKLSGGVIGSHAMRNISRATGGRVENQDTYLEALEEIFRLKREQRFAAF